MLRHEDNTVSRLNGNNLQPLAGISVTVTDNVTGLPASLYDDAAGTKPLIQPLTTDNSGYYGFYAPDGSYTLAFSGVRIAPFTRQIVLDDPKDNPYASKAELAAGQGAAGIGYGDRTLAAKLGDFVSVKDSPFNAKGDGVADDTAAIQAAFTACALTGKIPLIDFGSFLITQTIDAKGLPLVGRGRNHSKVLCQVADGTRTFSNVGQVVRDLWFKGPGNGAKPDGFSSSGYKRYIQSCYFDTMGDCFCPTDIIVTTVIDNTEFFVCQSNINDKLCDGNSSHTTLYYTNTNTLYGLNAFVLKTEVGGWMLTGAVFEDMQRIFKVSGSKQIAGSTFDTVWIEQVNQDCTIFDGLYSGSTNVFANVQTRPGAKTITDAYKVTPGQFSLTGSGGGGGGGLACDANGVRVCDFNGTGTILTKDGIKPSAAMANFGVAADVTVATQAANSNQASRGGDLIVSTGAGSASQRKGAFRASDDKATDLGAIGNSWGTGFLNYLKVAGPGGLVAPAGLFNELNNNRANGITLAVYSSDTSANTVCHQTEFAGPSGAVNGTGSLYMGKNNGAIVYRVAATGVVYVQGSQVLGARDTGWGVNTGATSKAAFDPSTVTLAQLAQTVSALQAALKAHGLIGA